MINIAGLDKACVLKALYDNAKTQGLGVLQWTPGDMPYSEAVKLIKDSTYFDYLHGRVMKVDLSSNVEFDERLYDRDNGVRAAERAISNLRYGREQEKLMPTLGEITIIALENAEGGRTYRARYYAYERDLPIQKTAEISYEELKKHGAKSENETIKRLLIGVIEEIKKQ